MKKTFLLAWLILSAQYISAQWTIDNFNSPKDINRIKFFGTTDVWLACDTGAFKSINNGGTFTQHGLVNSSNFSYLGSILNDVGIVNATTAVGAGIFFLGNDEYIVRTTNSGATWDSVESQLGTFLAHFNGVDFPTASTGYVVGWQGKIFRSTSGGVSWGLVHSGPAIALEDVAMTSANEGAAVGENGIYYTSNGTTWNQVVSLTNKYLYAVSFSGSTGYAAGDTLMKSVNNGASWTGINFPYGTINGIQAISVDTIVVVTNNMAYKTTNGGVYWEEFILPTLPGFHNYKDIAFRGPEGYIACSGGILLKTSNGGGGTKPITSYSSPTLFCEDQTYTFTNTSPVNYSFQWKIDGSTVATSYSTNVTFPDSGMHAVTLLAFNGTQYDTVSNTIYVWPKRFINTFNISTDTICPAGYATIKITNSQSGVDYQLRNGATNIGSPLHGNGSLISFPSQQLSVTTTYTIRAFSNNLCYSDSLFQNVTQIVFPNKLIPVDVGDTLICSSHENYQVTLHNTEPNVWYKLNYTGVIDSAMGNGGTLTLSTPTFYGNAQTLQYYIMMVTTSPVCNTLLRNIYLHKDTIYSNFNLVNSTVLPGDTISVQNYSHADSLYWTFPPQANIQTSTSNNPKIVINTPGIYDIKLRTTNAEGCADSLVNHVYVLGSIPPATNANCGTTFIIPNVLTPYDSYTDNNKNVYLTGCYILNSFDAKYFTCKIDSNGVLQWFKTVVEYSGEKSCGQGLSVDNEGNVYVAGYFHGAIITIDGAKINGNPYSQKGFLVKYDKDGKMQWVISGKKNNSYGWGMWFSDVQFLNGKIFFTGEHENGTFLFPDSTTFTATGDSSSAFLMAVDTAGHYVSYTTFGAISGGRTVGGLNLFNTNPRLNALTTNELMITSCYADSSNNMHTQFGTFNYTDTCNTIYSAIYNPTSGFRKILRGPSGFIYYIHDAACDQDNSVYLYGSFNKNYQFNGSQYFLDASHSGANVSYPDFNFIAKVDTTNGGWLNSFRFTKLTDVTVGSSNDLYFSAVADTNGYFTNQSTYPQYTNRLGKSDAVYGKYNSAGILIFVNSIGTSNYDCAYTISLDNCDDVTITTSENRNNVSNWPNPSYPPNGGVFHVRYFSKDNLCHHDAACAPVAVEIFPNDAALTALWPKDSLQGNTQIPLYITLKSYGTQNLTSAQIVVWVNGIQQFFQPWSGTLQQYESVDSVNLGMLTLTGSGTQVIKVFVDNPNGQPDGNHVNDTLSFMIEVCAPLAGTYTIGAGGNFETPSIAVRRLKECGISGHVYFDILPGIYYDRIILDTIPTGVNDSIVFRSANHDSSTTAIEWGYGCPYQNGFIEIRKSDYITFEKLTFRNLDEDNAVNMNIMIDGVCNHINIRNCVFERLNPDSLDGSILYFQGPDNVNNLEIVNNLFYQGGQAIALWGTNQQYTLVQNNRFIHQTDGGIQLEGMKGPIITHNYFESSFHKHNAYFGIGMSPGNSTGMHVTHNEIYIANDGGIGITISGLYDSLTPCLVANNMISLTNMSNSTNGIQIGGNCKNINVYNNSIFIQGNWWVTAGFYNYINAGSKNIRIRNNIVEIPDSGYIYWWSNYNNQMLDMDYNCYYNSTNKFAKTTNPGTTIYPTLTDWQTFTGKESHTKFHPANFVSTTDLHIINDSIVSNGGIPVSDVTDDIDGEPRNSNNPDIGADEFYGTTGIVSISGENEIIVFPNPVHEKLFIKSNYQEKFEIEIFDLADKLVYSGKIIYGNTVNISSLSCGTYFIKIVVGEKWYRSFIIKN